MHLGLFAGIRGCSPRAHFLALLFAVCRQISLNIVGVAVRMAVLLECGSAKGERGFELSATALSVFVGAICVLPLRARYLSLRSLFSLNVLALLHGEALGYRRYCSSPVVGFSQNDIISWMWPVLCLVIISGFSLHSGPASSRCLRLFHTASMDFHRKSLTDSS